MRPMPHAGRKKSGKNLIALSVKHDPPEDAAKFLPVSFAITGKRYIFAVYVREWGVQCNHGAPI